MKKINYIFIFIFFGMLVVPLFFFNFKEDDKSLIDNRELTHNPLNKKNSLNGKDMTDVFYDYVADRIGFRNFFIRTYTVLNDKLFNDMDHPTYEYGKDGYVFFKEVHTYKVEDDSYYDDFINMLLRIKEYCDDWGVPFIFAFEPSKSTLMTEYINKGINYDKRWIKSFISKIEDKGINVVNNYELLKKEYNKGEKIFNKKYDAGHWNDTGAYYGVNNILKKAKQLNENIHVNSLDEFKKKRILNKSLPVSEFPIHEFTTTYNLKGNLSSVTDEYYDDILIETKYPHFEYTINNERKNENTPKALVFQGSYMNGYGHKFFENSFYEYISVHNYGNVLNFDYYFNIFQPEIVILEVTEYTFRNNYFNQIKMNEFSLNPKYNTFDDYRLSHETNENIILEKHQKITDVFLDKPDTVIDYAYLKIGDKYFDARIVDDKVIATIENTYLNDEIEFILINDNNKTKQIYRNK